MHQRQRIAERGIVGIDGAEVLPDEESRAAGDRNPQLDLIAGPLELFAIGSAKAVAVPRGIAPHRPVVGHALTARRHLDLAAPGFAAPPFAALDQVARGAGQRVIRLAERIDAPVAIEIDADPQPHLGHPLRVAHGAGPRADHGVGPRPVAIDDLERVDQFGFPIAAAARLAEGEGGECRDDRPHVFRIVDDIAERRFHAPQAEQHIAVDAVVALEARQQPGIFLGALLAGGDAPVRAAAVDVLPHLLGEFGLAALQLIDRGVRFHAPHDAVIGRFRHAALHRLTAKTRHPLLERGALREGSAVCHDRCGQREGTAQQRAAIEMGSRGESSHGGSLPAEVRRTIRGGRLRSGKSAHRPRVQRPPQPSAEA